MSTLRSHQQGLALPVMLIMLVFMLVSSIYLFKSSNSTALTANNLAYDDAMSRAADLGIVRGSGWVSMTSATSAALLNADNATAGYKASFDTTRTVSSPEFWDGSVTIEDDQHNQIEYVIHRMCLLPLPYHHPNNRCMHTAGNSQKVAGPIKAGASAAVDTPEYRGPPQVHYIITSRIYGVRGGNVINQTVLVGGV